MNNPYWLVKIYNRDSAQQWKYFDGQNINAFILSNEHFLLPDTVYGSNGRVGTNAYLNVGLSIDNFKRSFSGSFFESCIEDIAQFQFGTSKAWQYKIPGSDNFIDSTDWINLFRSYSGTNFSLDGAGVDLWLCNGAIPGFIFSGTSTFTEIAGTAVKSYTPPEYNLTDEAHKVFSGSINKLGRNNTSWSFSCESIASSTDVFVGETVRGGENSTATIKPLCFGSITGAGGDYDGAFPCAQTDSRVGILKLSVSANPKDRDEVSVFRLMYRDSNTDKLVRIISDLKQIGNEISLADDIDGVTLLANRGSGQADWKTTLAERNALFPDINIPIDFDTPAKQIIHQSNDEQIGLHSLSAKGISTPPVVTPSVITFSEANTMDSRGWNNTRLADQLTGSQYNTEKSESVGIRILVEQSLPVVEMIEIPLFGSGLDLTDGDLFRGSTGNLWDMSEGTLVSYNFVSNPIKFSQRGYGPATWNGSQTNAGRGVPYYSAPTKEDEFRFVIRSQKPDIKSEDELLKIEGRASVKVAISNPSSPFLAAGSASFVLYPNYVDQDRTLSILSAFTNASTTGARIDLVPTGGLNRDFFDKIFDANSLALDIRLLSSWSASGSSVIYRHSIVELHKLGIIYTYKTDTQSRKLLWQGTGIRATNGTTQNAEDNIKTLVEITSNIDVDTSRVVAGSHTHAGYFAERITLRDAVRQVCQNHSLLARLSGDTMELLEYSRSDTFKSVTEYDMFLDDDLLLELDVGDTDLQDLYSEVSVKFRERADDGEFAAEIKINPDGWKEYNVSGITQSFRASKWAYLSSTNLFNLKQTCGEAQKILQGANQSTRILEIEARHIRDLATAEKLLAKMVLLNCVKRKTVAFSAPLDSWINASIGDQFEFNLNPNNRDSFIYQYRHGGFNRRFIITSIEYSLGEARIEGQELPYIPLNDLL